MNSEINTQQTNKMHAKLISVDSFESRIMRRFERVKIRCGDFDGVVEIRRPLFFALVVEVKRDDGELFAEGPPPTKGPFEAEACHEDAIVFAVSKLHLSDKVDDGLEAAMRPPVIRHRSDLAAKLEEGAFLLRRQLDLLEGLKTLGLAQDVVVQRALGNAVAR